MSNKREQRLRRKARAQVRAVDRKLATAKQDLAIALAAVLFSGSLPSHLPVPLRPTTRPIGSAAARSVGVDHAIGGDPFRDLEVKRREMLNAAKRLGAEANKRTTRDPDRVALLSDLLDAAARAFVRAEQRLAMQEAA